MNAFIEAQIGNMILTAEQFKKGIEIAAMKDDNNIDRKEQAIIKKLKKATDTYISELKKMS